MTLVSFFDQHEPDAIALLEGATAVTYRELQVAAAEVRAGLVAAGCEPGDRVAVLLANTRPAIVGLLGVLSGGMVAVPINPSSPANEIHRQLESVGARMLLVGQPTEADPDINVVSVDATTVDGVEPLAWGPAVPPAEPDANAPAVLLFTSGTAGAPKAAVLTAANLLAVQDMIIDHPDAGVGADTVNLCVLPLSHVYGLNISLLTTLRAGGTVVLVPRFDAAAAVAAVRETGVTHFAGVPPMWRSILDLPGVETDTFANVLRITTGASALPVDLFHEFKDRFGVELSEGYGLTETASAATSNIGTSIRPGSVGIPLPGIEVQVVDYDDRPAPVDDSGIIKIKGPNVFAGYWEDEEATKAVLDDDGWLRTGDVGVLSADGYLALVDRAKDLIIVSGFNVYPFEVEDVVTRHPAVDEVVVVGRDDETQGERVVAYITVAEGHDPPSLDDVNEVCRAELARYKWPIELNVVDELPIAPSGKRVRRDLA